MTGRRAIGAARELAWLFRDGSAAGLSDGQLLHRFASARDEASFAALVGRHGPMVMGVCRRIVGDAHEAEDAFQAAFLVLARKAGSIRVDDSLGGWLYTVARRIALRADASAERRGRAEPADAGLVAGDEPDGAERREVRAALDEELGRLPASYRAAVALCDLEGLTHREAARRLRWPVGTVKGRLARARGLLRDRLARRGIGLSAGAVAAGLSSESVSAGLLMETVTASMAFAACRATPAGVVPAAVGLARGALGGMLMARIKIAAAGIMALGVVGLGAGRLPALAQDGPAANAAKPSAPVENPLGEVERYERLVAVARDAVKRKQADVEAAKATLQMLEHQLDRNKKARTQAKGIRSRLPAVPTAPPALLGDVPKEAGRPGPAAPPAIEGRKRVLPTYVVEPPDLILVEVLEALPGRPITGERLVRPDGTISLQWYGDLNVAGLTVEQIKEKIALHLRKWLADESLGLVVMDEGRPRQVEPRESNRIFVDIASYNSKVYYVQGEVGSPGRLPVTGNETVLDGITFAGGLMPTAAPGNIRVVRPAPAGARREQILPVDLDAIIKRGDPTTNYQILPGDRIIVEHAEPSPGAGEKAGPRPDQVEKRLDAMMRELESLRRELREPR